MTLLFVSLVVTFLMCIPYAYGYAQESKDSETLPTITVETDKPVYELEDNAEISGIVGADAIDQGYDYVSITIYNSTGGRFHTETVPINKTDSSEFGQGSFIVRVAVSQGNELRYDGEYKATAMLCCGRVVEPAETTFRVSSGIPPPAIGMNGNTAGNQYVANATQDEPTPIINRVQIWRPDLASILMAVTAIAAIAGAVVYFKRRTR